MNTIVCGTDLCLFCKSDGLVLYILHIYRFYIENITFLKDTTTVELFFLNAKSCVFSVSGQTFHLLCLFDVLSQHCITTQQDRLEK